MPHSKHHEYTGNKQDITYTEIKTAKSPQKQRIPKAKKSPVLLSEEQVNYAELTFHRTPQLLPPKRVVRGKTQGPKVTVWKIVTGTLGALCVVLMTIVGILLPKLFSYQEDQSGKSSLRDFLCPKDDDSSCDLCSHDWIAFGNNFYSRFHKVKSWVDSQLECEKLNCHLLEIDSKAELVSDMLLFSWNRKRLRSQSAHEELNSYLVVTDSKAELENMLLFAIDGWILLNTNETDESWSWKNAAKIGQAQNNDSKNNHSCYYLHGKQIYPADCSSKKAYTCEFNIP